MQVEKNPALKKSKKKKKTTQINQAETVMYSDQIHTLVKTQITVTLRLGPIQDKLIIKVPPDKAKDLKPNFKMSKQISETLKWLPKK